MTEQPTIEAPDPAYELCARWHDEQYRELRDNPTGPEGLVTGIAGAHMAAHRESAEHHRALASSVPFDLALATLQQHERAMAALLKCYGVLDWICGEGLGPYPEDLCPEPEEVYLEIAKILGTDKSYHDYVAALDETASTVRKT